MVPSRAVWGLLLSLGLLSCLPMNAAADIDCDDFTFLEDAQAIVDGLGSDPYSLDSPRGSGAEPADGVLCEERPDEESALIPMTSAVEIDPVFDELPTSALPDGAEETKTHGALSEDNVYLDDDKTLELLGIELPGWNPRRLPDQDCFGQEAEARLEELLTEDRTVHLETDREERHPEDDKPWNDDLILGYLWIEDDGKYQMVNELLVREGYAVVAIVPPNMKYAGDLRRAQEEAIAAGAGLWAACQGQTYPPSR